MKRASVSFALVAVLAACANPAPSVSPTPSIALPSTEVTQNPAVDPVWQRVQLPDADAALNSIAATDHDVVIVGSHDVDKPAAWWSHDGGRWATEALPAEAGTPGRAERFGDRILVMGGMETSRCAHPAQATFAVRDAAGKWVAAPFNELLCAASSAANVAVLGDVAAVLGSGTGDQPYGWFSNDGLHWIDSGLSGEVRPQALSTAGGDFVSLGTLGEDRWWFGRTDGRHGWALTGAAGVPPLTLRGFAAGGDGVIAWLGDDAGNEATLTSARGDTWRSQAQDGREETHILSIRVIGGTYLAIGEDTNGQLLLASADGVSWRKLARPLDIQATGIYRDIIVASGKIYLLAQEQPDAPVWLLTAEAGPLLP